MCIYVCVSKNLKRKTRTAKKENPADSSGTPPVIYIYICMCAIVIHSFVYVKLMCMFVCD